MPDFLPDLLGRHVTAGGITREHTEGEHGGNSIKMQIIMGSRLKETFILSLKLSKLLE